MEPEIDALHKDFFPPKGPFLHSMFVLGGWLRIIGTSILHYEVFTAAVGSCDRPTCRPWQPHLFDRKKWLRSNAKDQPNLSIYIYVYILIFSKDLMLVFLKKTTSGFESVPPADGVRGTWWISDCGKVRWLASEFCLIVACSQVIVFDKHMKIYKKIFDILVATLIVWIQRLRECGGKPFVSFALPRSFCAVSGPPCRWLWANG